MSQATTREAETCRDVFALEIRQLLHHLLGREPHGQQIEHIAHPNVRNVAFFRSRVERDTLEPRETHTMRMKARIDSANGRERGVKTFM